MEGSLTSADVTSAIADGLGESDPSFFGRSRTIPAALGGGLGTLITVFYNGGGAFSLLFGSTSAGFEMWTDDRGLDAIIDACQAAKVRASRD